MIERLAVPVQAGDLLTLFLPPAAGRPLAARPGKWWRFEPRNLAFTDGLDRWELSGSVARDAGEPHRQDYSCAAEGQSAILTSAVPAPFGFAFLSQEIFADDYRGHTVVLRGELRTKDAADRAGLVLRGRHRRTAHPAAPNRLRSPSRPR